MFIQNKNKKICIYYIFFIGINIICETCFSELVIKKSLTKRNKLIPMHRVVDLIAPCCIVECAEELPNKL